VRNLGSVILLAAIGGCRGCSGCRPDPDVEHTDRDTDLDTDVPIDTDPEETADTGPFPPCAWPEVEPDGYDTPSPLALEEQGCGAFSHPLDADWWAFDVPDEGWLRVRVDARAIGSRADPEVALTADAGASVHQVDRGDGFEDVLLVFPAVGGRWQMYLGDQLQNGAEDGFDYDVMVSSAKAPADCTLRDAGANDDRAEAQDLGDSPCVQGASETPSDEDWYQLRVPQGKHTITLDIDAAELGSPGDFRVELVDATDTIVASASYGMRGWELDPLASYVSSGDETLFVRVVEEANGEGQAYWYFLGISLEAS
jgi:hypothetical protein